MAGYVNRAQILGNIGKDPEITSTPSGIKKATFSVATSESWKDKDGNKQEKTTWHNVVLWRGLAEITEKYLKKGSKVFISGKIDNRSWDKQDGTKGYISEIIADELVMLGDKQGGSGNGDMGSSEPPPEGSRGSGGKPPEDDLPF